MKSPPPSAERAEKWTLTRDVPVELPYSLRTVRAAIVKEQIAAFTAGERSGYLRGLREALHFVSLDQNGEQLLELIEQARKEASDAEER